MQFFDRAGPWLGGYSVHLGCEWHLIEPPLGGGEEAHVLDDMLLRDDADRDLLEVRVPDGLPELLLAPVDASRVVTERTVACVPTQCFGFVEPTVDLKVVAWVAAMFLGGRAGVVVWVH